MPTGKTAKLARTKRHAYGPQENPLTALATKTPEQPVPELVPEKALGVKDHYLAVATRLLLLSVCAAPLVVSSNTLYPDIVGEAVYSRVVIEVAFAAWVILIARVPDLRPRKSWIIIALFAWLGVSALAAALGVSPERSIWSTYLRMTGVINLGHWCLYALMLSSMFRERQHWRWLLATSAVVSGVVALIGVAGHLYPSATPGLAYETRTSSTLGNALFLGAYACISAGLAVSLMTLCKTKTGAALALTALALNATALWLSALRSGIVVALLMAAAFGAGCLLLDRGERRRNATIAGLLVAAAIAVLATLIVAGANPPDSMVARLKQATTGKDTSIAGRIAASKVALKAYQADPIVGIGPENFIVAWGRHAPGDQRKTHYFDHAHNKYLEVMATTGTLGIAAYVILCLLLIRAACQSIRQHEGRERLHALAMAATTLGYLTISAVMVDTTTTMIHFAIIAGYLAAEESRNRPPLWNSPTIARRPWLTATAATFVGVALLCSLAQLNLNIMLSAQPVEPQGSIAHFVAQERRLMEIFPPMAQERRISMLVTVAQSMARAKANGTEILSMPSFDQDINDAIAADPENWMPPYVATRLYQSAALHDPQYVDEARHYLEILQRMSPASEYTKTALETQRHLAMGDQ